MKNVFSSGILKIFEKRGVKQSGEIVFSLLEMCELSHKRLYLIRNSMLTENLKHHEDWCRFRKVGTDPLKNIFSVYEQVLSESCVLIGKNRWQQNMTGIEQTTNKTPTRKNTNRKSLHSNNKSRLLLFIL